MKVVKVMVMVKPVMLVASDGYILDVHGPYFADTRNNDAALLQKELEDRNGPFRQWLEDGDIFIADRGYRDAVPFMNNINLEIKIPPFLQQNQRQFTTMEANLSRIITKTRWVVEARNGHIKSIFKFFNDSLCMDHIVNIGDFYKIAAAVINRFHQPIVMNDANEQLAQEMINRFRTPNLIQEKVERERLATRNGTWQRMDAALFPSFPRITLDYLKDLIFGSYQIRLAPSYIQDKLLRDDVDIFQVDSSRTEEGFLRVRVYSRFRNSTKYQIFVKFTPWDPNLLPNDEPIKGYYCQCKTGARTLGTCAHVVAVIWYMGWARHQNNVKYPRNDLLEKIKDAAERYQNPNNAPTDDDDSDSD